MNTIDEENRFSECTPHPVNAVNPVGKVFSAPSAPLPEKILAKMDDSQSLQFGAPAKTESGHAHGRTRMDAHTEKCREQEKTEQTGCFLCCLSSLLFKNSASVSIGVHLWPIKVNKG